jgi:ribonuclease HI
MVHKWTLCLEVSCCPNPGQAKIKYVIYNNASNQVVQRTRDVYGRTTNNEAYYIALVEGLKDAKKYGAKDIVVYTNSELICNQMKGLYQVRAIDLKPIHKEATIQAARFQSFNINYHAEIHKLSTGLVFGEVSKESSISKVCAGGEEELLSMSIPTKVVDGNRYRPAICKISILVMILAVFLMSWLFR